MYLIKARCNNKAFPYKALIPRTVFGLKVAPQRQEEVKRGNSDGLDTLGLFGNIVKVSVV